MNFYEYYDLTKTYLKLIFFKIIILDKATKAKLSGPPETAITKIFFL